MRESKEIVWLGHRLDRLNVSDNRSKAYLKRVLMKFFLLDKQIWFHSSGSELKNHTVLPAYKICHSEYSDNQISSSLQVKNICSVIGGGSAVARVPNDLQLHLIPHIISQQQKMKTKFFIPPPFTMALKQLLCQLINITSYSQQQDMRLGTSFKRNGKYQILTSEKKNIMVSYGFQKDQSRVKGILSQRRGFLNQPVLRYDFFTLHIRTCN